MNNYDIIIIGGGAAAFAAATRASELGLHTGERYGQRATGGIGC